MKAIHLREEGRTFKAITDVLDITNVSQAKQWWYWYRDGEIDRLSQPIGKQYSFGYGPEGSTLEENTLSEYEILVIEACNETRFEYGYRNIAGILKREGSLIGVNTAQRIMQKYNLQCQVKPKKQKSISGKESIVANNAINREFRAERPLEKLVTDITYLPWGRVAPLFIFDNGFI